MNEIQKGRNDFSIIDDNGEVLAEITFYLTGLDKITIDHTYVCNPMRGQGVGEALVSKVVEYAREENKKILPVCPYAKKVMLKNEDCHDVLIKL